MDRRKRNSRGRRSDRETASPGGRRLRAGRIAENIPPSLPRLVRSPRRAALRRVEYRDGASKDPRAGRWEWMEESTGEGLVWPALVRALQAARRGARRDDGWKAEYSS